MTKENTPRETLLVGTRDDNSIVFIDSNGDVVTYFNANDGSLQSVEVPYSQLSDKQKNQVFDYELPIEEGNG